MRFNGKDYRLAFNLEAWANIEEAGIEIDTIRDIMKAKDRVRKTCTVAVIMANAADNADKIDLALFMKSAHPTIVKELYLEIVDTMNRAMRMETQDPDRERDLILEEIQKKSEPTG